MRIGFQVILFLVILNLTSAMLLSVGAPGTTTSNIVSSGNLGNATALANEFNGTGLIENWRAQPYSGIPIFGDVFSMVMLFWNAVRGVIVGFPDLMNNYAYSITDSTGRSTFIYLSYLLYAVFSLVIFAWLFQIISGRRVSE